MYSKMLKTKHQGQTILIYHVILLCSYLYPVCAKRLQFILRLGGNETDFTALYSRTSFFISVFPLTVFTVLKLSCTFK